MQVEILFRHCKILCAECGERIEKPEDAEWDHGVEWADGGPHIVDNIRPTHNRAAGGCHQFKSKRHEAFRHHIDRIEKRTNANVPGFGFKPVEPGSDRCGDCGELKGVCRCLVRVKRKAKINGQGFDKTRSRKFDGSVVPR
jgi:hypothetical protein